MTAPDRGLQPQRTALAWTRTAVAMVVNAVLIIRLGIVERNEWLAMAGLLVGALSVVVFLLFGVRHKQLDSEKPRTASCSIMLMVSVCAVLAACCGGWAML